MNTAQQIVEHILRARGLESASDRAAFLEPDYEKQLHDPFELNDMKAAVKRILAAVEAKETIGIFGDYDIDGITATTVLTDALTAFGVSVVQHIPNRFIEGYGMSNDGVDALQAAGATLIITVDCGSTSHDEISFAKRKKIDVIVTDHHEVPAKLPPALALINPKRPDNAYPYDQLAGVGVAFKLVQALQTKLDGLEAGQEKWLLDAVAFGTVCDVVPLTGENRVLVYWGLKVAAQSRRIGFKALASQTDTDLTSISSQTFGFVFGPRLNAAGRLDTAKHSLDLMLSDDEAVAFRHAQQLDQLNSDRRHAQRGIFEAAVEQAETMADDRVLVVSGEGWAEGVVGIVASKLVEKFGKPAFVLSELEGGRTKGSARSFGDFSVVKAIRAVEEVLIKGGGHAMAGGLTLETANIAEFRTAINKYYETLNLVRQSEHLKPKVDVTLDSFDLVGLDLIEQLAALEPFGMENPEPLFEFVDCEVVEARAVGSDKKHLKLGLSDGQKQVGGIGFGLADEGINEGDAVRVVASLSKNEFRGNVTAQMMVKSIEKLND